jgi:hypothetical protein
VVVEDLLLYNLEPKGREGEPPKAIPTAPYQLRADTALLRDSTWKSRKEKQPVNIVAIS